MKRQTVSLALIVAFLFCAAGISHARYYDPESGRFISRDPIGYEQGVNLYEYVASDPANRLDPTGEGWIKKAKSCCRITKNSLRMAELLKKRKQIQKSVRSFEGLIAEHEDKLRKYLADPDAYDDYGRSKDPRYREKVIEGRKRSLEKQIEKQKGELQKSQNELAKVDSEIKGLNMDASSVIGCLVCPNTQKLDDAQNSGEEVSPGDVVIGAGKDVIGIFDPGVLGLYDWIFCGDE